MGGMPISYRSIIILSELQFYINSSNIVAIDFDTAPDEKYRNEKSHRVYTRKIANTASNYFYNNSMPYLIRIVIIV